MRPPVVAAIFGCVLSIGHWSAECNAQRAHNANSNPPENQGARSAADVLVQQLGAPATEVHENAAIALEAMGPQASKALVKYISDELNHETQLESAATAIGITNAETILGRIGNRISEDTDVRVALLSAAKSNVRLGESNWSNVQIRLAAIEALGKINEHRGDIFPRSVEANELQAKDACDASVASQNLEKIADELFGKFATERKPPSADEKRDNDFYLQFKILHQAQAKIIKIAVQVKSAAALSNTTTEPIPPKLTDADELEKSVHKIYASYLNATKQGETAKPNADKKGNDKTVSDSGSDVPPAYDMLTEARELTEALASLCNQMGTLENDRVELDKLISDLGEIPQTVKLESAKRDSDDIKVEIAKAVNRIFSKPSPEKPIADTTKTEATKKEASKKDATKGSK
jgi:hypothetical protein